MDGKNDIRARMRMLRRAVSAERKSACEAVVCAKLERRIEALPIAGEGTMAVYLASPEEIGVDGLAARALLAGRTLVAPRWNGTGYELAKLEGLGEGFLRRGPMGIREPVGAEVLKPQDVRVWLVPGLAFTRDGRRLGYGGGWYDRMLASASPDSFKFGVAYAFQVVDELPCEPHDVPLTDVVDDSPPV